MVGANIGSTGDGAPLRDAKNLRRPVPCCLSLQNLDIYTLHNVIRAEEKYKAGELWQIVWVFLDHLEFYKNA